CGAERVDSLLDPTLAAERQPQVVPGLPAFRIALDRLPIGSDRLVGPSARLQALPQVVVGARQMGLEQDGLPVARLGLRERALSPQRVPRSYRVSADPGARRSACS